MPATRRSRHSFHQEQAFGTYLALAPVRLEPQPQVTEPAFSVGVIVKVAPVMAVFTPEAVPAIVATTTPLAVGAATVEYLPVAAETVGLEPVQEPATWQASATTVLEPSISVNGSEVWALAT